VNAREREREGKRESGKEREREREREKESDFKLSVDAGIRKRANSSILDMHEHVARVPLEATEHENAKSPMSIRSTCCFTEITAGTKTRCSLKINNRASKRNTPVAHLRLPRIFTSRGLFSNLLPSPGLQSQSQSKLCKYFFQA